MFWLVYHMAAIETIHSRQIILLGVDCFMKHRHVAVFCLSETGGNTLYSLAHRAKKQAVDGQLNEIFDDADGQRCQARRAVEHGEENGVECDIHNEADNYARADDLPGGALGFVQQHAVDDTKQRSGKRETRKIRTGGLEHETKQIAERALKTGDHRAEENRCGGNGQMREGNFEAVGDFDDAVGREHHLNRQQKACGCDGARARERTKRIAELRMNQGKNGMHKKHLRQIKLHKGRMIRRDDNIISRVKRQSGPKRYREGNRGKDFPSSSHVIPVHEHLTHLLRRRTHRGALPSSRIVCDMCIIRDVYRKGNGFAVIRFLKPSRSGEGNLRTSPSGGFGRQLNVPSSLIAKFL